MAFAAGQKLTAALLQAEFDRSRTVSTPGDQSVTNSAVLVNSTNLVLSVAANTTYVLETLIMFDANATADFQYTFALPAGAFIRQAFWASSTSAATADATIFHQAVDVAASTSGGVAFGTYMSLRPSGIIITGSTAGNCQFQFAQNTANATNPAVLKGGSWMRLVKIG